MFAGRAAPGKKRKSTEKPAAFDISQNNFPGGRAKIAHVGGCRQKDEIIENQTEEDKNAVRQQVKAYRSRIALAPVFDEMDQLDQGRHSNNGRTVEPH